MGIPIEHEHTKDRILATDIALQHLDEIPDYYTRLKKMEADAKKHHKKFKDVKEALDGKTPRDPDYSLGDWFKGWVQTGGKYDGKPCARQPGQTTKPYCRDADVRASMSKDERSKRAAKKRREDPNPDRSGAAKIVTQEEYIQEKKGEKDACYHKVKSRYKIWPSAYASGALVKCRKVGADNWGTKSEAVEMIKYCPKCQKSETREECKYGSKYWDMFSQPIDLPKILTTNQLKYNPNRPHPANEEKDHEYSMARSELSTIISAAKRLRKKISKGEGELEAWVQSKITKAADYIDTAADYVDSGEMQKESVTIQDANGNDYVEFIDLIKPEKIKTFNQFVTEASAAWQRKEGKNPEGGLNKKGIASYRREHPGSHLSLAVTTKPSKLKPGSKKANRRKSFCSRMKGMKAKLTSAKTAHDPNSRINKSLRKWNC